MFIKQKPLAKFKTKSQKQIEFYPPTLARSRQLLKFINRLVEEDTFLSFTGKPKTLAEEIDSIKKNLKDIEAEKAFVLWAVYQGEMIASCDILRGGTRDWHVGKIGLMVDRDFRREGIGRFMVGHIIKKAKEMGIEIVVLDVFSDNFPAINLYQQFGFQKYACLPDGFSRKNKYSDALKYYRRI